MMSLMMPMAKAAMNSASEIPMHVMVRSTQFMAIPLAIQSLVAAFDLLDTASEAVSPFDFFHS
jgi:hypothetical protein